MSKELNEQLQRLGHKAELLTTRYSTLKSENRAMREEIADLQSRLRAVQSEREQLALEVEYLRMSATIAPDGESADRARALLTNLVREIDACVADLMKDI